MPPSVSVEEGMTSDARLYGINGAGRRGRPDPSRPILGRRDLYPGSRAKHNDAGLDENRAGIGGIGGRDFKEGFMDKV